MPMTFKDPFGDGVPVTVTWTDVLDGVGLVVFLFIILYVVPVLFQLSP